MIILTFCYFVLKFGNGIVSSLLLFVVVVFVVGGAFGIGVELACFDRSCTVFKNVVKNLIASIEDKKAKKRCLVMIV
jgi:hypothetical protein